MFEEIVTGSGLALCAALDALRADCAQARLRSDFFTAELLTAAIRSVENAIATVEAV